MGVLQFQRLDPVTDVPVAPSRQYRGPWRFVSVSVSIEW